MSEEQPASNVVPQQQKIAWKVQKRSQLMTKRYDFSDYDEMRDFLDDLESLSESESYYPDLTFSRAHVNVSIKSREEELSRLDFEFSEKIDALIDGSLRAQE